MRCHQVRPILTARTWSTGRTVEMRKGDFLSSFGVSSLLLFLLIKLLRFNSGGRRASKLVAGTARSLPNQELHTCQRAFQYGNLAPTRMSNKKQKKIMPNVASTQLELTLKKLSTYLQPQGVGEQKKNGPQRRGPMGRGGMFVPMT